MHDLRPFPRMLATQPVVWPSLPLAAACSALPLHLAPSSTFTGETLPRPLEFRFFLLRWLGTEPFKRSADEKFERAQPHD